MTALGGSVSATRFERLRRTLTFYRFLKPSPIARESAFRSNSSRFTDTLGKLFASGGVLSNLISKGSNVDISYDSNLALGLSTSYFNNAGLCSSVAVCKVASSYHTGAGSSTFCRLTLA